MRTKRLMQKVFVKFAKRIWVNEMDDTLKGMIMGGLCGTLFGMSIMFLLVSLVLR